MTKIDQIQPGAAPGGTAGRKAQRAEGDKAFRQVLEEAASRVGEGGKVGPAASFDPLSTIQGAKPPLTQAELSPEHTEGLMHAGRALDTLERYEQALGDGRKSLKDVAMILKDLDSEVKGLTQVLDKLDPSDKLYGLLQEVAVTSMVQSLKFNRGDFLPADTQA